MLKNSKPVRRVSYSISQGSSKDNLVFVGHYPQHLKSDTGPEVVEHWHLRLTNPIKEGRFVKFSDGEFIYVATLANPLEACQ